MSGGRERIQTIVIGGGQAGLAVGYELARKKLPFIILNGHPRVGDSWRNRWDSLKLFSPARFSSLTGMPVPAERNSFISKDQMADYLESYAAHFDLPVRNSTKVEKLTKEGDHYVLTAGDKQFEAEQVVVAMANFQKPRIPLMSAALDAGVVQLHSFDYRNPSQLQDGDVLVVGVGNSGADIAMEVSKTHRTWLAGKINGVVPFRIEGAAARLFLQRLVLRGIFHRLLTVDSPIGRKARPGILSHGGPLVRIKPKDLTAAGVERLPKAVSAHGSRIRFEDGHEQAFTNVIWCTGFTPGFDWIDLPIMGEHEPIHQKGLVESYPGLYFVGLEFLYALSSSTPHGVGRDAERIVKAISARTAARRTVAPSPALRAVSNA